MGFLKKLFQSEEKPSPNLDNSKSMYPIFDSDKEYQQHSPWKTNFNSDSDYSNAIFLDWVSKKKTTPQKNEEYPRYMAYELGIYDPVKKCSQMIETGYLTFSTLSDSLHFLKVTELKEILEKHNLPTSGKKCDLISRIENGIDLNTLVLKTRLVLSESGKCIVRQYEDYIELFKHKSWEITADMYKREKSKMKNSNFYDVILSIFQKQLSQNGRHRNYGSCSNIWSDMEYVYKKKNDHHSAVQCFVNHVYITISGCENDGFICGFSDLCSLFSKISLNGKERKEYKEYFSPDMVKTAEMKCKLPFHYFDIKNSTTIISKIIDGEKVSLRNFPHKRK